MFQRKQDLNPSNMRSSSGKQDLPVLNDLFSVPVSVQDSLIDEERGDLCSPTGVLEDFLRSAESETSSSKATTPSLEEDSSDAQENSRGDSGWRGFVRLLKNRSTRPLCALKHSISRSNSMREYYFPFAGNDSGKFKSLTLSELQSATNNFSYENMIGKGGYAEVYKGCLEDGQYVAIKRLTRGTPDERIKDFLSELGIMAHVSHPNTARLIGYGVEGGLYFVLQLSPNGSLASMMQGSKGKLKWGIRYKVAVGAAEGLLYLHEGCQKRIIHRDIKAANILLTHDYTPQICDFGLAKWLPEHWTHQTVSNFQGTFGYLAPEYLMHGIIDEKTDVFAFGVLLLELITGRRALDYSRQSLVMWAKPLLRKKKIKELIDPSLGKDYNPKEINLLAIAASSCVRHSSARRPGMSQVVQLLKGDISSSSSSSSLEGLKRLRKPFFQNSVAENKPIKDSNAIYRSTCTDITLEF